MKKLAFLFKDIFRSANSLLVVLGVIFSFVIPATIYTVSESFIKSAQQISDTIYGRFDNIYYKAEETFTNLSMENNAPEDTEYQDYIREVGTISILSSSANNTYIEGYMDQNALKMGGVQIRQGRLPEKSGEIAVCISVLYKNNLSQELNTTVSINNKDYTLVGILNDFSAQWTQPKESGTVLLPNILLSLEESNHYPSCLQRHLLFTNQKTFPSSFYSDHTTLLSNVSKAENDAVEKYGVPPIVLVFTSLCALVLNFYLYDYYFKKQQRKMAILRCFNMNRKQAFIYMVGKVLLLVLFAIPIGILLSFGISSLIVFVLNKSIETTNTVSFSVSYTLLSIVLCLATVIPPACIWGIKIFKASPIELLQPVQGKVSNKAFKSSSSTPYRKTSVFRLTTLEFRLRLRQSIAVVLLITLCLSLFNFVSIYMKGFTLQRAEVEGRVPSDFDYEFVTALNNDGTTFVDASGATITTGTLPNEDSIYRMPDHSRILSENKILELSKNNQIQRINTYMESNDLYLTSSVSEANPYAEGFINNAILPDEVANIYHLPQEARNIQMYGYSEEELLSILENSGISDIDMEKILSGEEVILMAPIYELETSGDGSRLQLFLTPEKYQERENQWKDQIFSVGDQIDFVQLVPEELSMSGYLTESQMQGSVTCKTFSSKIGAIIYQHVGWFDTATTPPVPYSLLGLNETFSNMGILPTVSRARIYLKDTVSYEDFDPVIQSYVNDFGTGFNFRNNAAEMEEFHEFQVILNSLYSALLIVIAAVIILIFIFEEKIRMMDHRRFYALLRLNGLTNEQLVRLTLGQSLLFSLLGIALAIPIISLTIALMISVLTEELIIQHSIELAISCLAVPLVIALLSLISVHNFKKHKIAELLVENA